MTTPPRREVFLEFRRVGNAVKATALDPETLTEVSVVGPATGGQEMLRRTVVVERNLQSLLPGRITAASYGPASSSARARAAYGAVAR